MKSRKLLGFTLIELLIVIAIIGILAVAFLPSLLNAPAKGRDTQRIADLQKIQKVLVSKNLEGKAYPNKAGAVADVLTTGWVNPDNTWATLKADFGGALPVGPVDGETYAYYTKGDTIKAGVILGYSFGLVAKMETTDAANGPCPADVVAGGTEAAAPGPILAAQSPCYIILMK